MHLSYRAAPPGPWHSSRRGGVDGKVRHVCSALVTIHRPLLRVSARKLTGLNRPDTSLIWQLDDLSFMFGLHYPNGNSWGCGGGCESGIGASQRRLESIVG